MPIRISGMNSGLDTEALVAELVSAYNKKTDKYVKAQTKVAWKQEAWKTMSARTSAFRKSLDSLRFSSAYKLKTTSISNSSKATVTAGNTAVNGTQTLEIKQLAKSGYLTGAQVKTYEDGEKVTSGTTLGELGIVQTKWNADKKEYEEINREQLSFGGATAKIQLNGKEIELRESMTIKEAVAAFKDAGVDASFDETNQRIFISAKASGKDNDFTLCAMNDNGVAALKGMGIYVESKAATDLYTQLKKYDGQDVKTLLETYIETYNENVAAVKVAEEKAAVLSKAESYVTAKNTMADTEKALTDKLAEKISSGEINSANKELVTGLLQSDNQSKLVMDDGTTYTYHKADDGTEYYTSDNPKAGDENTKYYLKTVVSSQENNDQDVTTRYLITEDQLKKEGLDEKDPASLVAAGAIKVQTADAFLEQLTTKTISAYRSAQKTVTDLKAEADAEGASGASGDTVDYQSLSSVIAKIDADSDPWKLEDVKQAQTEVKKDKKTAQTALNDNSELKSYADRYTAATDEKTKGAIITELEADIAFAVTMDGSTQTYSTGAVRIDGQDAKIILNDAEFTSNTNSFNINGLTINAMAETEAGETLSITTSTDNQGIYDKIKDFLSEYNSLINAMTSSYNAENTNSYEPLTSDEKDAMSEKEVEKWEEKGKSGILRRDSTLSTLMSTLTGIMSKSYTINGKNYALSSFGIKTLGIMNSEKNEHNAYHIDGDADDDSTSSNTDKLMAAIASDPDGVAQFFQKLSSELYDKLGENMTSTSLRSYGSFYNDKEMAKEYSDYTKTISNWEEKVADIEDSYYKKFAAMEKALAELQSQTSQLSGLLGM